MNLEKDFIRGLLYEYKTHSQIDSIEKIDDKDILNIMKSEDMRAPIITAICSQILGEKFIDDTYNRFVSLIDECLEDIKTQ